MTASESTEWTPKLKRNLGCLLLIPIGVFFGGIGAATLFDEYRNQRDWRGATIDWCWITGKDAAPPLVTCEIRHEGDLPLVLKVGDLSLWRRVSIPLEMKIEVEYLPSDPSRVRYLPFTGRNAGQTRVHHLRGIPHMVVGGILLAIGLVPLYHGVRLILQNRNRPPSSGQALP